MQRQTNIGDAWQRTTTSKVRRYPLLMEGFLEMWREKMRWRNESFEFVAESVKAQLPITKLGAIVKIENTASVKVWDGSPPPLSLYLMVFT